MSEHVSIPMWVLSTTLAVGSAGIGYVKGQVSSEAEIITRIAVLEKENTVMRSDWKETVSAVNSLTVNVAKLTVEMKNFNENIKASD